MGELEKRNLEVVKHWAEFHNDDVDRMVTECYAENCTAASMLGGSKVEGTQRFRKLRSGEARRSTCPRPPGASSSTIIYHATIPLSEPPHSTGAQTPCRPSSPIRFHTWTGTASS